MVCGKWFHSNEDEIAETKFPFCGVGPNLFFKWVRQLEQR